MRDVLRACPCTHARVSAPLIRLTTSLWQAKVFYGIWGVPQGLHAGQLHAGQLHAGQLHAGQLHAGQLHARLLHTACIPPVYRM